MEEESNSSSTVANDPNTKSNSEISEAENEEDDRRVVNEGDHEVVAPYNFTMAECIGTLLYSDIAESSSSSKKEERHKDMAAVLDQPSSSDTDAASSSNSNSNSNLKLKAKMEEEENDNVVLDEKKGEEIDEGSPSKSSDNNNDEKDEEKEKEKYDLEFPKFNYIPGQIIRKKRR